MKIWEINIYKWLIKKHSKLMIEYVKEWLQLIEEIKICITEDWKRIVWNNEWKEKNFYHHIHWISILLNRYNQNLKWFFNSNIQSSNQWERDLMLLKKIDREILLEVWRSLTLEVFQRFNDSMSHKIATVRRVREWYMKY